MAGDDGAAGALARTKQLAVELKGWGVLRVAGDLAATLGDDTSAVAYWKQAIELGADDATIANLLAQLGQSGRIDELVAIADELPRLGERDPGPALERGGGLRGGRPDRGGPDRVRVDRARPRRRARRPGAAQARLDAV